MGKTIWYISKYVAPSYAARAQTRGFLLLSEFARLGHRAVLITSDSNHALSRAPEFSGNVFQESVSGVEVVWLRTAKYRRSRSLRRIASWIHFELRLLRLRLRSLPNPDAIVVSSLSLLTILNGFRLKRKYGCKLVFEVRDIWPMVLVTTGGFSRWNPFVLLLGWIERMGYRHSDLVVGTMPNLGERVIGDCGVDAKVACVPQGIDPELISGGGPVSDEFIETYIPKDKFIVCYAGSIGADNALDALLACAREMSDRENVVFLLVGVGGDAKTEVEEGVAHLPNLIFAPGVPKSAVQSVLRRASVLYFEVHDSPIWKYGQSLNKVIDYMLAGKPIVASYSGYPSMIDEAGCGVMVPAGSASCLRDEIERLACLPDEELVAMGERGRRWVLANRGFDTLATDYLRALEFL